MSKKSQDKINILNQYSSQLQPELERLVAGLGYKLLKLVFVCENQINYLRLAISHHDHFISLNDCELVSKEVEKELDEKDLIPFSYTLEVESPGIESEKDKREFEVNHEDMQWLVRAN